MAEDCVTECCHPVVKLSAHGQSANFRNPQRKDYAKYEVDGCLVKNSLAADCAIEEVGTGLVVVEFKGRNVEHGLKQVAASLDFFRTVRGYRGAIAALIVSRESPLGSATMNRHREKFARKHHGAALKVASSASTFEVGRLLSHRG